MPLHSLSQSRTDSPVANLVLLHGLGADETDLINLAPYLDERLAVQSLRAPRNYHFGGYSWFDIEIGDSSIHVDNRLAQESLNVLIDHLESLSGPLFLAGFSQGAMMSLGVAMQRPDLVRGVVAMSGALLPSFEREAVAPPPILITHGLHDPVVPCEESLRAAQFLKDMGAVVDVRTYSMGHEISMEALRDLSTWLEERVDEIVALKN